MNFQISIVLVEPENPDNIGAVARALWNMGCEDLRLVRPPASWKKKGKKMAMGGFQVLQKARVFQTVEKAIGDSHLVIGTSRRQGIKRGKFLSFGNAIKRARTVSKKKRVSFLFGKESKGLDNASLEQCDWVTTIPANPAYPSLNLAQAVMVTAFSLFASKASMKETQSEITLVPKEQVYEILEKIRHAIQILGYREEGYDVIDRIVATFHGLFKRNGLMPHEAQMFRGLTRRISERIKDDPHPDPLP